MADSNGEIQYVRSDGSVDEWVRIVFLGNVAGIVVNLCIIDFGRDILVG